MRRMPLGEVCEINPRKPHDLQGNTDCSFVPMEYVDDVSGTIMRTVPRSVADVAQGYTFFADNDVIFAKITPCMENGKCALATGLINGIGFGSTEFHVLRANSSILPQWIYHFLRRQEVRDRAAQWMTGTAGQQRVPAAFLERVEIPLPSLPEQQRIAAILAKADRVHRLRRYALELGDDYLQAVFRQMFGAQLAPHAPSTPLGDLVTITGGGTPSRDVERYYTGSIPWLTSKDMIGDYIFDTQEHITQEAVRNSATKLVPAGSILVVVKSKILMRRLPVAIAKVPLCHGQDIKSIQCSHQVDPVYLVYVLKHHEPGLLRQARGANTEGLTLPMLNRVPVPTVEMATQKQFAEIVCRFERLRSQQREALRQAEHLFQTLLHRAFTGGL